MSLLGWLSPWEPSPTVVLCILAASVIYLRGSQGLAITHTRQAAFMAGLVLIYISLHTQFDYYAEHAFFVHRIQHLLLHHVAPFLIALSQPAAALVAGMPAGLQQAFVRAARRPSIAALIRCAASPWLAVLLFNGLILFWLLPPVHYIRHARLAPVPRHELEHAGLWPAILVAGDDAIVSA